MRKLALLAASAVLLSGCVSVGTKVSADDMRQFQRGVTTEGEVIAKLGDPTARTINNDGTIKDDYVYSHATADATSYIPIVGLFAGGAHGQTVTVSMKFDARRVLMETTSTTAQTHVKTGIF